MVDTLAPASAPPAPSTVRRPPRRIWVAVAVVVAAIGFLIYKGVTSAFVYFKTADQALADRQQLGNSTFQIEGTVLTSSLVKTPAGQPERFVITSNGKRVAIDNSAVPPQLFAGGVPVVLVGHFIGSTDVFASGQILVKHSNQYKAAHPNRVRAANGQVH